MKDKVLKKVLVKRNKLSNKGNFGHTLLYIGSPNYIGCTLLVSKAALYGGAGYIDIAIENTPPNIYNEVPEVIYTPRNTIKQNSLTKFTSILFGNGLVYPNKTIQADFDYLMFNYKNTMVIDATGLKYLKDFYNRNSEASVFPTLIITPHIKEFTELVNIPFIDSNALSYEKDIDNYLKQHPRTVVTLKSYNTLIKSTKGRYYIDKPNPGLAKAGSGDALAGLIASILAYSSCHNIDVAYTACKLMSLASFRLKRKISSASFTTMKVTEEIPYILKKYIK